MEEGEADLDPGCDWETPPARDLGRPFLSGVPEGRPPPGPASDDFRGRDRVPPPLLICPRRPLWLYCCLTEALLAAVASMAELLLPGGVWRGDPLLREDCLDRVDLVMASLIPVTGPGVPLGSFPSFPGEADHLGIPLEGFRPRVADPELITRVGGLDGWLSIKFS